MKPILFNSDMVRAIQNGTKTVTRRVVKPQPEKCAHSPYECCGGRFAFRIGDRACTNQYKPPYRPGDILYVRETWCNVNTKQNPAYFYKADNNRPRDYDLTFWRPSIHMPKEAARLFLRVTGVQVERLQDIDGKGVFFEGIDNGMSNPAMGKRWENMQRMAFQALWDSTIKPADRALYGWDANPWVWWIKFERCEKPKGVK